MVINQGDLYWASMDKLHESRSEYVHPHVIVQINDANQSGMNTVTVCPVTTNMKQINLPGNVLLEAGEGNLPKRSIVVVSQVLTFEIVHLGEYIGSLSRQRIDQILAGMKFVQRLIEHHES